MGNPIVDVQICCLIIIIIIIIIITLCRHLMDGSFNLKWPPSFDLEFSQQKNKEQHLFPSLFPQMVDIPDWIFLKPTIGGLAWILDMD